MGNYPSLDTVQHVDTKKYAGLWYEICRLPAWFEKEDAKNVTADYALLPNGNIQVINTETLSSGQIHQVKGEAVVVDPSNAKLKVHFNNFDLFAGDYWILYLNKSYTLAAVGTPDRRYLWILARKPKPDKVKIKRIIRYLRDEGKFQTERLMWTKQSSRK